MWLQPAVDSSDVQTTTRDVDKLFVGGLPGRQFARLPASVHSKDGFHGCLASIDLDGRVWSPAVESDGGYLSDIVDDVRQFVKSGCPGKLSHFTDCIRAVKLYRINIMQGRS